MAKRSRPKTGSERATQSRAEKIAAGYAAKQFLLSPRAQKDLAAIVERAGSTETEAVELSLRRAAETETFESALDLAKRLVRALERRK